MVCQKKPGDFHCNIDVLHAHIIWIVPPSHIVKQLSSILGETLHLSINAANLLNDLISSVRQRALLTCQDQNILL